MPPVDMTFATPDIGLVPVFLPELIGKEECHDHQRHDQKSAKDQILDHNNLHSRTASQSILTTPPAPCTRARIRNVGRHTDPLEP